MEVESLPFPLLDEEAIERPPTDLSTLRAGEKAFIERVRTDGLLRRRLLDLGFLPGTEVEAVLESPSGDPVIYEVRGTRIALRRSDARLVEIRQDRVPRQMDLSVHCSTKTDCNLCASSGTNTAPNPRDSFIVALAGNPNTGKTTLFNALTGLRQHVGNWPGKTVTRVEGSWRYEEQSFRLVDLPGTYSLLSTTTDEEIARDYILFGAPDCTVVVVDTTCLERNLNLVFQILEITDRVVVCANLLDEARRKKITLDLSTLEEDLGVPVVGTVARTGRGLDELKGKITAVSKGEIVTSPRRIPYDTQLQEAIDELEPLVKQAFPGIPQARWIALRLIEGGDSRLREEIESGVLGNLSGQIGAASLGGAMSPQTF